MKKLLVGAGVVGGIVTFGSADASADSYTVQSGDTLNKIAKDYNTSVDIISQQNNISDINLIFAGEQLQINTNNQSALAATNVVQVANENVSNTVEPVHTQETVTVSQNNSNSVAETTTAQATTVETNSSKEWIANKESSGSYTAQNPSGAYGKYQLMPGNLKYGTSPQAQEKAADEYVQQRYGGWDQAKEFWQSHSWY